MKKIRLHKDIIAILVIIITLLLLFLIFPG